MFRSRDRISQIFRVLAVTSGRGGVHELIDPLLLSLYERCSFWKILCNVAAQATAQTFASISLNKLARLPLSFFALVFFYVFVHPLICCLI